MKKADRCTGYESGRFFNQEEIPCRRYARFDCGIAGNRCSEHSVGWWTIRKLLKWKRA